jgi:hypothetical protein
VLTDPDGLNELRRLGARSVPVLSRGDDWIFAQNLSQVAKFAGIDEDMGPKLSPDQLVQRLILFIRTAIPIIRQMPDDKLSLETPGRPRTYRVLGHHMMRIPDATVMVANGAELYNGIMTDGLTDAIQTANDIGAYGEQVLAKVEAWWAAKADKSGKETVQTYYGPQSLHEMLERSTWHCGQHVRQWFMLLEMAGVTPPAVVLEDSAFVGLPMPTDVWDG